MLIVVASLKGGSGKSTVAFNLAVWLARAGNRVCAFDLDPQATLSDVAQVREEEGYQPPLPVVRGVQGLEEAAAAPDRIALADVGVADLDSMNKAMSLADRILVPITPSQADIWSAQRFVQMVDEIGDGSAWPPVRAFINRGDTHHAVRESDEAAAALVALPGVEFVKSRLHQRTVYRRSFSEGLAVFELEPKGKGAQEFTRLASRLFPEVLS